MFRRVIVLLALASATPALAQQDDKQFWFQTNAAVPLLPRFRVTLEQIARFGERQDGLIQTEYGALFGYKISDQIELGGGYRYVGLYNSTARDEHRIRQQVIGTFGRFATRFRIDERFHPEGKEVGVRIRPMVRYNQPLDDKLTLFVSHESFYLPNTTSWGQRRGYERMRNVVGMNIPLGKTFSADVGYLNQFRPKRSGSVARMDHALSIQLNLNLSSSPIFAPHD